LSSLANENFESDPPLASNSLLYPLYGLLLSLLFILSSAIDFLNAPILFAWPLAVYLSILTV